MEGEGRTEDIYSLPKYSTNSLESRPATRRKDYTRLVAFLIFLQEGNSQTVLHCAHQGSTFRSCDPGEPEEWSGCSPPPPKLARYHSPHIALTESPHIHSNGGRADSQLRASRGIPSLTPSHAMRKVSQLILTIPFWQYRIIM